MKSRRERREDLPGLCQSLCIIEVGKGYERLVSLDLMSFGWRRKSGKERRTLNLRLRIEGIEGWGWDEER